MTRRQEFERQRRSLGEIREIMNSMKTLAYMETRKLARFLDAQHAIVESIEEAAADFLGFHTESMAIAGETTSVYLVVGTERGFCGDFNQSLMRHLESTLTGDPGAMPILLAVGRKLHSLIGNDDRVAAFIEGASVVEEVPDVLNRMVSELSTLQTQHGMVTLFGLYHGNEDGIVMQKLLPPFQQAYNQTPEFALPPVLNLSPDNVLIDLTEQYLFAALHEMLYTSLMLENQSRVAHLEGAVKHLDDEADELDHRCNALRQEEIIEEIEVILLSTGNLDESAREARSSGPQKSHNPGGNE